MVFNLGSTARWLAPLCAALALGMPTVASAQNFNFGLGFFSFCGLSHSEPFALPVKNDGSLSFASINHINTIQLADSSSGRSTVLQNVTLRIYDADGTLDWKAGPFYLKSNPFVSPLNLPGFEGVVPAVFPDVTSHLAVFPAFGGECVGAGVVESGGKRYVVLSVGTAASEGTARAPVDLSKINLYVFNAANGNRVFTHKIRPRNGWFLSALGGPNIVDYDGDGSQELVIARVKGLANNKAQFQYDVINIANGNQLQRTNIYQTNNEKNENPELGDIPFP